MSPLAGFPSLRGRRVGVFGVGVEGDAARRALLAVGVTPVLVDDHPSSVDVLGTADGGLEALARCEIVLKSPGIPRRRDDVLALEAAGVLVTSALEVWRAGADRSRLIAVTGTKGKSTTTSVITFLLHALDQSATAVGNIGLAPYDPDVQLGEWVVLETSSFQATDLTDSPAFIVVTSLGEDHLDWHGSVAQYHEDKLRVAAGASPHQTFTAVDVPVGGERHLVTASDVELASALRLLGHHNARNVALALAVVAAATTTPLATVRGRALARAASFTPLPGRLTVVTTNAQRRGITVVDDGLATNPVAALAAITAFEGTPRTMVFGGFDRGVDYGDVARALDARPEVRVVVCGPAGRRLAESLATAPHVAVDFTQAVNEALACTPDGGLVVVSPAAPSFDEFANWTERSSRLAALVTGA